MRPLAGLRILLVEDEFIIAQMAMEMLVELGAAVVGPAGTVASALDLARSEAFDAALLDVNLRGERVDPVAEVLKARGIPFVLATGYDDPSPERALLAKPYTQEILAESLSRALSDAVRQQAGPPPEASD